ncbi:MAG: DUF3416 domain-containing protein, partial [Bifidobacteriaceae bacterium]|nr:DUF3416 domain-containing protein [Bifidobacteriaceae bacterium]
MKSLITQTPTTIINIEPHYEDLNIPAKVAIGELFPIKASIFQEGHQKSGAKVIFQKILKEHAAFSISPGTESRLQNPINGQTQAGTAGEESTDRLTFDMTLVNPGRDTFLTFCELPEAGLWSWQIVGWREPEQDHFSESRKYLIQVSRERSLFSAWYQLFPRSEGAIQQADGSWISGTFQTAAERLPDIKKLGFDIVYIPPIHPIGHSFRKGKDNAAKAGPNDPGSPWGIGNETGGHDVVQAELGGIEGLRHFVKEAKRLGLEVSLDFALQTSRDHPWVKEHPNWYGVRADGTIAYAENPPKKYQDIYPLVFDKDPEGIIAEIIRLLELWIQEGIKFFRVDNPHTKPVWVWERVIATIKERHPDVLFLAEAFTKPPMMQALALAGFDQSHSYFLWRNTKKELKKYFEECNSERGFFLRPTFWPTTPDNLTEYLVKGGIPAHKIRAILAATGSASWGIYSGYEFAETKWSKNHKEFADNEKYEFRPRDWSQVEQYGISQLLGQLNQIRQQNPVFRSMHNLLVHKTNDLQVLAYGRHQPNHDVLVVVNLDYAQPRTFQLTLAWRHLLKNHPELVNHPNYQSLDTKCPAAISA